jgi:hypothetical protein
MAQRIVQFMPVLNGHCHLLVFDGLFRMQIEGGMGQSQSTSDLAFRIGAIGPT